MSLCLTIVSWDSWALQECALVLPEWFESILFGRQGTAVKHLHVRSALNPFQVWESSWFSMFFVKYYRKVYAKCDKIMIKLFFYCTLCLRSTI